MFLRFKDAGRIGMVGSLLLLACSSSSGGNGGAAGSASSGSAGTAGSSSAGAATGGGGSSAGSTAMAGAGAGGMTTAGAGAATGGAGAGGSAGSGAGTGGGAGSGGGSNESKTTFFVTSDTSKTGKLGGLEGADKRCQDLAVAAGIGDHTFHAYLSTATVNAKDRIGTGPWVNANGIKVADSVAALHAPAMKGDHTIFVDEKGMPIHGQWDGGPVEHDILTGSMADGTVAAGKTCMDWTSDAADVAATVGHSDGMGPDMATTGAYTSWNSSHDNMSCADTAPRGGAGRIYCFATN